MWKLYTFLFCVSVCFSGFAAPENVTVNNFDKIQLHPKPIKMTFTQNVFRAIRPADPHDVVILLYLTNNSFTSSLWGLDISGNLTPLDFPSSSVIGPWKINANGQLTTSGVDSQCSLWKTVSANVVPK